MIIRIQVLIAILLSMALSSLAVQTKDAATVPITEVQLRQLIQKTPLDSTEHSRLMARAQTSHLYKVAYEQYTLLWKAHPKDAHANLLRGVMAEEYWLGSTYRSTHINLTAKEQGMLFDTAQTCLAQAVKLQPNLTGANTAYGLFLWNYRSDRQEDGLSLIKKAVALNPKGIRAHVALGEIYSNPYRKAYAPQKAEAELRRAIELDPTYSYAHYTLIHLYLTLHRYQDAQKELQVYSNLLPANVGVSTVKFYQQQIDRGLGHK